MAQRESIWRTETPQRWAVYAAVGASILIFWRPALDDFTLPKATAVFAATVFGITAAVVRAFLAGRVGIARTPFLIVVAIFLMAAAATLLWTVDPTATWFGQYGRYLGILPFLAYVLSGVLAVHVVSRASSVVGLMRTLIVAGGIAGVYTLIQRVGLDWWVWDAGGVAVFGTLGNSNFASAILAMTAVASVWQVGLTEGAPGHRGWRMLSGVIAVIAVLGVVATASTQGLLALSGSLLLLALVALSQRIPFIERSFLGSSWRLVVAAALLAGAGVFMLLIFRSQFVALVDETAFRERRLIYEAASNVIRDRPVTGVGFDAFGSVFMRYRPPEHAVAFRFGLADEPHSVLLGMFADGGLLVGLAYLAILIYVGWRLVVGLVQRDGLDRWILAGLGSVWLGYQIQSLVSIDEPALAVVHWVTAGALIGFAERPGRLQLQLPAALRRRSRSRPTPVVTRVAIASAFVLGVTAMWLASRPLRADVVVAEAEAIGRFAVERDNDRALIASIERFRQAQELAPWIGRYKAAEAAILTESGRYDDALEVQLDAAQHIHGDPTVWLNVASLAEFADQQDVIRHALNRAVDVDPWNPDVLTVAAETFLELGDRGQARQYVKTLLGVWPGSPRGRELAAQLGVETP